MNMSPVKQCAATTCAYNQEKMCHTPGIMVGHHAECNSYNHASRRGGYAEVMAGVGSCLAEECRFNQKLECHANEIDIDSHSEHADCGTFEPKS